MAPYRLTLGPKFSEGARRLWLVQQLLCFCSADFARAIGVNSGLLSKWLYGERRPSAIFREHLEGKFGIRRDSWDDKAAKEFTPPARAA